MSCKWQVEIDDFCQRVLTKHWPNVPKFGDIKDVGKHNLEPVDLICGGFPCQPFSELGERKGEQDERALWGQYARIIGEINPRWILGENVSGILSIDNGRYFRGILRDLYELGYDAEWGIIPASYLGALHKRERVYIVAYPNSRKGERWRTPLHVPETSPRIRGARINYSDSLWNSPKSRGCSTFYQIQPLQAQLRRFQGLPTWENEPGFCRVVNGPSNWMDRGRRLKGIGNAVVPQIPEILGRMILEIEQLALMES